MRKVTFILSLLLFGVIYSDAQLPNGSNVPDFTVTDINGNQHTLSSYLNTGKTVILEFSGVGCGASWKYLRTEALQDFYNAYGLPGSNEAVVLFIERSTTIGQLEGEMNTGFGNWLEGTPFPMVLDTAMHSLYVVNYEPLIYRICPNGIISNMGQPSAATYASLVRRGWRNPSA